MKFNSTKSCAEGPMIRNFYVNLEEQTNKEEIKKEECVGRRVMNSSFFLRS